MPTRWYGCRTSQALSRFDSSSLNSANLFLSSGVIAAIITFFISNPAERMNWVVDAPLDVPKAEIEEAAATAQPARLPLEK